MSFMERKKIADYCHTMQIFADRIRAEVTRAASEPDKRAIWDASQEIERMADLIKDLTN